MNNLSDISLSVRNFSIAIFFIISSIFIYSLIGISKELSSSIENHLIDQSELQRQIIDDTTNVFDTYTEVSLMIAARTLENQYIIEPSTADEIVNDSLLIIEDGNPRLYRLIKELNDYYIDFLRWYMNKEKLKKFAFLVTAVGVFNLVRFSSFLSY